MGASTHPSDAVMTIQPLQLIFRRGRKDMRNQMFCLFGCVFALMLLNPSAALSADTIIQPGDKLTLERDLILSSNDRLEIRGTAGKPTMLDGQHHKIRTRDKW